MLHASAHSGLQFEAMCPASSDSAYSSTTNFVAHCSPPADGGHEALLDAELLVDPLHERREAVRRARRARDHLGDGSTKAPRSRRQPSDLARAGRTTAKPASRGRSCSSGSRPCSRPRQSSGSRHPSPARRSPPGMSGKPGPVDTRSTNITAASHLRKKKLILFELPYVLSTKTEYQNDSFRSIETASLSSQHLLRPALDVLHAAIGGGEGARGLADVLNLAAVTIPMERQREQKRPVATENKVCEDHIYTCLLYTSPSPRDQRGSRMPSSA